MDFVGPFPEQGEHDYLWVMLCRMTSLVHLVPVTMTICQVQVYSGRGSSQVWMKADEGEGQRAGQGISLARVETDWIQRQGGQVLIPCVGSGQGNGVGDRQRLE